MKCAEACLLLFLIFAIVLPKPTLSSSDGKRKVTSGSDIASTMEITRRINAWALEVSGFWAISCFQSD